MLSERYGAMFGQYEENGEIIEDEIEDEVAALETALKDAEAEKPRLINRIVSLEEDLYFTIYPEENDELPPKAIAPPAIIRTPSMKLYPDWSSIHS